MFCVDFFSTFALEIRSEEGGIRSPDAVGRAESNTIEKHESMARIFYVLRQNKNEQSKICGKWFAHSKTIETVNTRKLAQHISEHGSIYTPDVVYGVLEKFRSCLLEMQQNLQALHIRFLPEQEAEMNISSRQFLKKAKFVSVDALTGEAPNGSDAGSNGENGSGTNGGNDSPANGDGE